LIELPENKRREGLGFSPSADLPWNIVVPTRGTFHSASFINALSEANAVIEDNPEGIPQSFVNHGGTSHNWVAVDVPFVAHLSK
jgi:hypothetical protein